MKEQTEIFEELCQIPPLKEGWVRLVHRCIDKGSTVPNITKFGLVFNKEAAGLSSIRGGSYNTITEMASAYDEKNFWESLKHDNFYGYDNAGYADTKLVFDMPMEEFCFLETFGRRVKGKVDAKYLVAKISNINGENTDITLPQEKVRQAQLIVHGNPYPQVQANNLEEMVDKFLEKIPLEKQSEKKEIIKNIISRNRDNFLYEMQEIRENKKYNVNPQITSQKGRTI